VIRQHTLPYTGPFPMSGASVYGHPRTTSCTGYPEADAGHPRATPLRVAGGDPYTHCPPPTLRGLRCEATHGPRILTGYPEAGVAAYVATPRRGPTLQYRRTTSHLSTPATCRCQARRATRRRPATHGPRLCGLPGGGHTRTNIEWLPACGL
jgi:hypothetical protein